MTNHPRSLLRRAALALTALAVAGGLAAPAATADDTTVAWSVVPADATGAADGRTRFELEADPGTALEEHVLVTNSSTVEREFAVYGADGFNTPTGGYDLAPAATAPVDLGSWVTTATPTVTIPALTSVVVPFTIDVPADATPGDHPGGLVVSPVRVETTDTGVVVDSRVAVRLNVRVAGEIAAALEVRAVSGTFDAALAPFAPGLATVTYEVVNTGNVKVIGVPRVRVSGPFGLGRAEIAAEETREVLPGDSFTVTTEFERTWPVLVATAVVDVETAAAPGPQTEIPLVSSTARATFTAVSWTGLALLALVVLLAWAAVSGARRRRHESEELWDRAVADAARGADGGDRTGAPVALTVLLAAAVGLGLIGGAPPAAATPTGGVGHLETTPPAEEEGAEGALTLTVPGPGSRTAPPPWTGPTSRPTPRPVASPSVTEAEDEDDAAPAPADDEDPVIAAEQSLPDLLWSSLRRDMTPGQWGLVGLAAAAAAGGLGYGLWAFLARRRKDAVA